MKNKILFFLLVLFLLISFSISGYSAQNSNNNKVYNWTLQSTSPSGILTYKLTEDFAKDILTSTDGRLKIEVHALGAVVPFEEITDSVNMGSIEAGTPNVSADLGRIGRRAELLGASGLPGGMGPIEFLTWFYEYGGIEYLQNEYDNFNIKVVGMLTVSPAEVFAHTNKPLREITDFKGLKFRTMGLWGQILTKLGASVVTISGGEIYEAMQRGVIDAFEFCGAGINWDMGYEEIASYVAVPGIHSPLGSELLLVNKQAWDDLPNDLKKIVEDTCKLYSFKSYMTIAMDDAEKLQKFEDSPNVTVQELTPAIQEEIIKVTNESIEAEMEKDPVYKKIYESQKEFMNLFTNITSKVQSEYTIYE